MTYSRGAVVKGPDLFGGGTYRPYICLTDKSHPLRDEEGLYAAVTTTHRSIAIPLADDDFIAGGLPKESYVSPWVLVTLKHADVSRQEGQLSETATNATAEEAAGYLGVFVAR
jgi:hypothetical protein